MKCATSWTRIRGNSARVQSRTIRRSRRNDPACTGPRRSRNSRTTSTRTGRPSSGGIRRTTAAIRGSRERNSPLDTMHNVPSRRRTAKPPESWRFRLRNAEASVDFHYRLEHLGGQVNAARLQTIVELRPDAGGAETPADFSGFRDARFFEKENVDRKSVV